MVKEIKLRDIYGRFISEEDAMLEILKEDLFNIDLTPIPIKKVNDVDKHEKIKNDN